MSIINTKNGLIGTGTFDAPTFGVGLDTLVLGISQDAWANGDAISDAAGDARFAVMVGGVRVGPIYTAQVAHGAGQQNFTIHLNAPVGDLAITVSLINDAWGGTPQTDRNLYVNSLTYNGGRDRSIGYATRQRHRDVRSGRYHRGGQEYQWHRGQRYDRWQRWQ